MHLEKFQCHKYYKYEHLKPNKSNTDFIEIRKLNHMKTQFLDSEPSEGCIDFTMLFYLCEHFSVDKIVPITTFNTFKDK